MTLVIKNIDGGLHEKLLLKDYSSIGPLHDLCMEDDRLAMFKGVFSRMLFLYGMYPETTEERIRMFNIWEDHHNLKAPDIQKALEAITPDAKEEHFHEFIDQTFVLPPPLLMSVYDLFKALWLDTPEDGMEVSDDTMEILERIASNMLPERNQV